MKLPSFHFFWAFFKKLACDLAQPNICIVLVKQTGDAGPKSQKDEVTRAR